MLRLDKLRKTIRCECNAVLKKEHLKGKINTKGIPKGYYGNRVHATKRVECPRCHKEYEALLKAEHNSYTIMDTLAIPKDFKKEDILEMKRPELLTVAKGLKVEGEYWRLKKDELLDVVLDKCDFVGQ